MQYNNNVYSLFNIDTYAMYLFGIVG